MRWPFHWHIFSGRDEWVLQWLVLCLPLNIVLIPVLEDYTLREECSVWFHCNEGSSPENLHVWSVHRGRELDWRLLFHITWQESPQVEAEKHSSQQLDETRSCCWQRQILTLQRFDLWDNEPCLLGNLYSWRHLLVAWHNDRALPEKPRE